MQTILEILDKCAAYFGGKGVPEPKLDAQTLLAHSLGCKRLELFLRFDEPLPENKLADFREMARRRAKREPLQHILGRVEFFGVSLKSDARALVPRPETEELCEIITTKYFADKLANIRILDLGTGSGAIAIALAKHYENAQVEAVDFSDDALALAKENAEAAGVKNLSIKKSDWFENVDGVFDLIVANPPYLTDAEVASAQPEVKDYDPHSALLSPDSGLADLRKILAGATKHLKTGGVLACECGLGQPEILAKESAEIGYSSAESLPDMSRRTRFLICKK